MERPELTSREARLLDALKVMKLWVVHAVEPAWSGKGDPYESLKRDLRQAELAIAEATGDNE